MRTIPLRAGTFTLPAGLSTYAGTVTLTLTGVAAITVTDPTGAVYVDASTANPAGVASTVTLAGVQAAALPAGLWNVQVTGTVTAQLTTN